MGETRVNRRLHRVITLWDQIGRGEIPDCPSHPFLDLGFTLGEQDPEGLMAPIVSQSERRELGDRFVIVPVAREVWIGCEGNCLAAIVDLRGVQKVSGELRQERFVWAIREIRYAVETSGLSCGLPLPEDRGGIVWQPPRPEPPIGESLDVLMRQELDRTLDWPRTVNERWLAAQPVSQENGWRPVRGVRGGHCRECLSGTSLSHPYDDTIWGCANCGLSVWGAERFIRRSHPNSIV